MYPIATHVQQVSPAIVVTSTDSHAISTSTKTGEHYSMSTASQSATDSPQRLIIEVEAHHGTTHVHVRYPNKPEVMFFVNAPLSDRHALTRAIQQQTSITEEDITKALIFL
jgi:hypothetical protein